MQLAVFERPRRLRHLDGAGEVVGGALAAVVGGSVTETVTVGSDVVCAVGLTEATDGVPVTWPPVGRTSMIAPTTTASASPINVPMSAIRVRSCSGPRPVPPELGPPGPPGCHAGT